MVELVIGTPRSELILRDLNKMRYGDNVWSLTMSYEDRLSDIFVDSLHLLDFVMEVEDHYDIVLGTHELADISTVSELVELIESKI